MKLESINTSATNRSLLQESEDKKLPEYLLPVYVPIGVIIVTANVLVFVLFARSRSLRTPTNMLLLSLSISDCASGLVDIPVFVATTVHSTKEGNAATIVLHNFTLILTAYHILVITAEKYLAIMKPFHKHSSVTKSLVTRVIVAIWLISAALAALEIPVLGYHPTTGSRIYVIFSATLVFVLPFLFMFYAYIVMFCTLRKRKTLALRRNDYQIFSKLSRDWKCLSIFATMLIAFLVCWSPYFAIKLVLSYVDSQNRKAIPYFGKIISAFTILRYGSSMINPFLYTLLKADFITALKTLFSPKWNYEYRINTSTAVTNCRIPLPTNTATSAERKNILNSTLILKRLESVCVATNDRKQLQLITVL